MAKLTVDVAGCRILAVDDTPANLEVLIEFLEGEGFDIAIATGGEKALELAGNSKPDLILLDVMMPGIDGFETCRRLMEQEDLEDVPVIFVTARNDLEAIMQGFKAGGDDYVTKPFNKVELLARIRTRLERVVLARDVAELRAKLESSGTETS